MVFSCPIKQPASHCSVCHFIRDGKCAYTLITKERDDYAKKLTMREQMTSDGKL